MTMTRQQCHISMHCFVPIANHHLLWQPLFNCPPPPLHTQITMTVWQHHITGTVHMPFWMTWWRRPGMSTDVPHCLDGDNPCRHPCPHYSRWATWYPSPSIHTRSRSHIANSNVATNNEQRMMNYSQSGEPSHCPPPLIFWYEKQIPHWLMMEQQHRMTTILTLTCTSTTTHPSATLNILTKVPPIVLKFCGYAQVDDCALLSMRCCGENKIKKSASVMQANGCWVRDPTARHNPMIMQCFSITAESQSTMQYQKWI